ncbi:hypothetical protein PR202_ga21730 [Eleusine coracana subsp. coracana]|uniref:F-box domain-containing protein n=1 Tax=Eleusine coracana subsp. coracana TaxID=191504 RepID=A0AAV5D166_ELECO|nr:hypothetical protein PR202_ga21730 [Eleusine coracana subsp. coracana]
MDHCKAVEDVDRISALPDDLLHLILGRLGFAPAVTKTAVLSRRWRHVWPHARRLRFKDDDKFLKRKRDFAGFVDWVLSHRGDGDMESLKILFKEKGRASPEKINEWLRYAARRVVGSVKIDVGPKLKEPDHDVAVELPIHGGRATSISLSLSNHRLRLPSATSATYEALTKLTLDSLWFTDDGMSTLLGDFVMSCCPRLRRLEISRARGLTRLVLRTDVLQELDISSAHDLQTLDVTAPNLRLIALAFSAVPLLLGDISMDKVMIRIVAPRLEEFHRNVFPYRPPVLDIRGLESVRRLKYIYLDTHGKYHSTSDLWLLQNCPAAQHVHVNLHHSSTSFAADELVDLTAPEGNAPLFANVRSMSIIICGVPRHHLVASISSLLMRCPHLTSITIKGTYFPQDQRGFKCACEALLTDRCTVVHGKLALESLQEVKIIGFGGTAEEMQLVSFLFGSSNSLERANIQLRVNTKVEAGVNIFHQLTRMKIPPCADQERWSFQKTEREKVHLDVRLDTVIDRERHSLIIS